MATPGTGDGLLAARPVVPGVWRVEVPSRTLPPFTSTNAYVVGRDGVTLVIDPGGDGPESVDGVARAVAAAGGPAPKGIVLTHTHADHVGGVAALLERWPEAAVYAHPLELGRLDPSWRAKGLAGGRRLTLGGDLIEALHTPGHSPGHLALWLASDRLLLAGDLVAGAGSVWVGLPEGDVAAYLDSVARAAALEPVVVAPGHGPVRFDGAAVLHEARAHRLEREREIVASLRDGPRGLREIRERVYPVLAPAAVTFADRSILAHLRKLMAERRVMHVGEDEQGPFLLPPGAPRGDTGR